MIGWYIPEDLSVASYRYRCLIPMRGLRRLGQECVIGLADTTVFSKHYVTDSLQAARGLKQAGGRVLVDICDDHFGGKFDEHYRGLCEAADVVTVPTAGMADRVLAETGRTAELVPDPYEYPLAVPAMPSGTVKRLLWYGHPSNLSGLQRVLPALKGYEVLVASSQPLEGAKFMPWSREGMLLAYAWCDAVIIPVEDTDKAACKSPNRLVEAVRQGRYVISEPLPSYEPYGMWSGDIAEGLERVKADPAAALQAVGAAQGVVERLNNPLEISKVWNRVVSP